MKTELTMTTDTSLMDFIANNEALLTHATDHAGTDKAWRCWVPGRHFASPDCRERCEHVGYANNARDAVVNCIQSSPVNAIPSALFSITQAERLMGTW